MVFTNGMHVEVCLPSFTSTDFPSYEYEEDDCNIYGGEKYNILGDDDCKNVDHGKNKALKSNSYAFEVHGAGSCLVADFLGIAGYEQALVLPRLDTNLQSNMWNADAKDDESIQQQKQLLQIVLRNSFITDGSGILLSKHLKQIMVSKENADDRMVFNIPPLVSRSKLTTGAMMSLELQSNDATGCSELLTQEEDSIPSHEQSNNATNESSDSIDTNIAEKTTPQEDPTWLDAITQTVEHRLAKEVEESEQLERSTQARSELVYKGRKTLHAASRPCHLAECWSDPETIRLRYGTRPRTSIGTCGGMSVVLDLELDVMMHSFDGDEEPSANKDGSLSSNVLHDFHLSCSLANNNQSPSYGSSTTTPKSIRTVSGVVPTLQSGDCITILACAHLNDLKMNMQGRSDTSTLDISIQALWVDASSEAQNGSWNPVNKPTRRGSVLCILRLPVETLLLAPPMSPAPRSGHWIQNEIDFTSDSDDDIHRYPVPSAIFEYRQPRTLTVDTSGEVNSAQDSRMWKELVSNLNGCIGGNSFIDLYCKKGDPRLKLVIFGSNPEERAATVKLVLRSLPESAKLIIEDPNEKQNVKALLMSLKREADALKRHRALPSRDIRPEMIAEMAALQKDTDGVASTIKRGWV